MKKIYVCIFMILLYSTLFCCKAYAAETTDLSQVIIYLDDISYSLKALCIIVGALFFYLIFRQIRKGR
ncbi:MAG: hypothetical protein K0S01_2433 [Herbinix sp.]|jgi:hypothetical protein|nr:hypothetical protein [Herbinix sp.]